MIKETIEVAQALRWYNENPNKQYAPHEVLKFDEAARTLTERESFAKFFVEKQLNKPGKTLEIAAGTGLISKTLSENIIDLTCTDISPAAVCILKDRVGNKATVEKADFFDLPYEDNTFDTVVCVGGYRYVASVRKEEFWQEMERILIPKTGRLYIAQFYPRIFPLKGNDININGLRSSFRRTGVLEYVSSMDLRPFRIASGRYLSFEFSLLPNGVDNDTVVPIYTSHQK